METPTHLNNVVAKLAAGEHVFGVFAPANPEDAMALSGSDYDLVVFEMEHSAFDVRALSHALHYFTDRAQVAAQGNVATRIAPFVRIPANGSEMNQWQAKQVLDAGVYGVIWPHVTTVEEARNAVASCRYPRPASADLYQPPGVRGDSPKAASRYWGISQAEYYRRADVWPLNESGDLAVIIMCEDAAAVENLPQILKEVPGIAGVLVGEGDLSQDLGHPREYTHPAVQEAVASALRACQAAGVPCGIPHVNTKTVKERIDEGFQFFMALYNPDYSALNVGREYAKEKGSSK